MELDSNGKAFVNVPWVNTTYSLSSFGITATAAEINKLDGLATTAKELGYVHGVTSNIQTQLNGKQATVTGAASTITASNLTANRALVSNASGKVAVSAVTSTELGYLDGVTSNIQTQLNAKANASALAAYALKDGSNASGTWPISISGNAGTVGGYTAERVARTMFYLPRVRLVDAGWYRVFSLVGRTDASGANVLLHLTRLYNVTNNEAYTFSITIAYNGGISITQLSGRANARLIDKIRVTYDPNVTGSVFVDFHISTTVSGGNEYFVSGIGPGSFQSPVAVTETPAHSVEFSTVNGVGSNIGFVGPLEGDRAHSLGSVFQRDGERERAHLS